MQDLSKSLLNPMALFSKTLQFFLPSRCISCRTLVEEEGYVCPTCWGLLTFISDPYCDNCSLPFEVDSGEEEETLCASCLRDEPEFSKARTALLYTAQSKELILRFKHGDAIHMVPAFSSWMTRAGEELLEKSDYIVPVPLHWKRLFKRRFNQAALLSKKISERSQVPVLYQGLERLRHTPSQGSLSKDKRAKNVSGAFKVSDKYLNFVNKKVITLVDDVYTSGSTVNSCAKALKDAGAAEVYVLTLARVARL